MFNEYGVDVMQWFNPCVADYTWIGPEERKTTLDHLIIDFDLIDTCRTAFKIDDACFSDHLLLILSIRLSVNAPVIPVTHYKEIVDVERLIAENVNKIQEKLCGTTT
jgi:hypothetical protein